MNDKFCPECGTKIEDNERFCQNCGAEIPQEEPQNDTPVIGAGARANIMGGINKTTNTNNFYITEAFYGLSQHDQRMAYFHCINGC